MSELITSSGIRNKYTSTGRHSGYRVDLYHSGLDEHKHLTAVEQSALLGKINNQSNLWEAKWEKELTKQDQQTKEETASNLTTKAREKIAAIEGILNHTLLINDAIVWDSLKHKDAFSWNKKLDEYIQVKKNGYPEGIHYLTLLAEPQERDFFKKISFFNKVFGKTEKILAKQRVDFDNAVILTRNENDKVRVLNNAREARLTETKRLWENEKALFEEEQNSHNAKIDELKAAYQTRNIDAIIDYCEMVLNNSLYPDEFPKDFDLQYNEANGMLLIDYQLPVLKMIPKLSSARYIKSRDAIEEKELSQSDHAKLYDTAIYQIVIRTLHEIFEADQDDTISAISLNGFVTDISLTSGHEETSCIISIQTNRAEFQKINLKGIVENSSYKECFKSLKGVGSSKLSTMTAVKPILELNKSDKRFRDHYDVAHGLNEEVNIAAMDWEDFEHLVREVFAKEFSVNGGEVRVTQASSDGGVDAIAFDPDPIRGGKIVIQAKRYTNVVGVSAVRDLYGTVMNEGASKGILVTTADYGSDSYEFAKGKPITLLNGANLLHLLAKHGHKAKIDVKEAKRILSEK